MYKRVATKMGDKEPSKKYPMRKSMDMDKDTMESLVKEKLDSFKEKLLKDFSKMLDERTEELVNHVMQRMDEIENNVTNNTKNIKKNAEEIKILKENYRITTKENKDLKQKLEDAMSKLSKTEDELGDKTNRQLRKTLIFTNVIEESSEQYDVSAILAKTISKASQNKITETEASNFIERAHRGKAKLHSQNRTRPIYVAISDWRFSERLKEVFLDKRNKTGVFCEQMYGQRTTQRRNLALAKRKELKASNEIIKGYVAFPARLMVKKEGDVKYKLFKDFSNEKVTSYK